MTTALEPIDTLGAEIKARIEAGEKAEEKAEQHYIAAGIRLAEAKARLERTHEMRWSAFLFSHARISRRRADDLMAIGDGRISLEQHNEKNRERVAAHRERKKQEVALRNAEPVKVIEQRVAHEPDASEVARLKAEIEDLRRKLAKSQEKIKEMAGIIRAREYMVAIAEKQSKEAHTRALFAESDKERLADENARLCALVMNGGSRDGLHDEHGDDVGGYVFVIGAGEDSVRTCMLIEPFWPLRRGDSPGEGLKTFLGMNRADWRGAPDALVDFAGMRAAVELWNVEYERDMTAPPEWPDDPWDCLQERHRMAGIPISDGADPPDNTPVCVPTFLRNAA